MSRNAKEGEGSCSRQRRKLNGVNLRTASVATAPAPIHPHLYENVAEGSRGMYDCRDAFCSVSCHRLFTQQVAPRLHLRRLLVAEPPPATTRITSGEKDAPLHRPAKKRSSRFAPSLLSPRRCLVSNSSPRRRPRRRRRFPPRDRPPRRPRVRAAARRRRRPLPLPALRPLLAYRPVPGRPLLPGPRHWPLQDVRDHLQRSVALLLERLRVRTARGSRAITLESHPLSCIDALSL